jgi:penicillin V acylase-like amidase (Ntn superfamily)
VSLKTFNDLRERNIDDLISYKPTDFYSIGFTKDRNNIPVDRWSEWWTNDRKPADELIEFLSQYRVKKVNEDAFNDHLNKDSFEFTISNSDANPIIVHAVKGHVHILVGNYYEIVNGPIDIEWIRKYNEKHLKSYRE